MWLILGKWRVSLNDHYPGTLDEGEDDHLPKGFCTSVHTLGVSAGPERVKTHLKWMAASNKGFMTNMAIFPTTTLM